MIEYIGSKRLLLPAHPRRDRRRGAARATVADLFSGTARVGHALKRTGYRVLANDHNAYTPHTLATCTVQADAERWAGAAQRILDDLSRRPGRAGMSHRNLLRPLALLHPQMASASRRSERGAPAGAGAGGGAARAPGSRRPGEFTASLQMAYMNGWAPGR